MVNSYNNLCNKEMEKGDLCNIAKISKGTIDKMTNNGPVTLTVVEKICDALQCDIGDVVQMTNVNNDRRGWHE